MMFAPLYSGANRKLNPDLSAIDKPDDINALFHVLIDVDKPLRTAARLSSSIMKEFQIVAVLLIACVAFATSYDYKDVLEKSLLFYETQRSGKLPSDQKVTWRKDSALNDKGNDGEDLTGGYYDDALDDALKAIKWGTDYFIKAHTSENEFYAQVASGTVDHSYWGRPEDMTMERPAFKITTSAPGSDLAAETAAALAAASLVFQSVDSSYSTTLLQHAVQLFNFANTYRGKYTDAFADVRCCYNSSGYEDELVWGAAWLYRATNDNSYLQVIEEVYPTIQYYIGFNWDQKAGGADYSTPDSNPHVLTGALVGGPGANDDYEDVRSDYQHNEVGCVYNAAFQGVLATLIELSIIIIYPVYKIVCYDYATVLQNSLLFYEAQRSGKLPSDQKVTWRKDSALNDKGDNGEDLTGGYYDGALEDGRKALKWATDYFIKAHTSEFEFYGQVGDGIADHNYWGRPEDMTMDRPAFKITESAPGSDLAAETAAALAAASLVFKTVDSSYSATLLQHAIQLFNFANTYRGKFSDSIVNVRCCYNSSNYNDELVWGAAWLYRATEDNQYLNVIEQEYPTVQYWIGFDWDQKTSGADYSTTDPNPHVLFGALVGGPGANDDYEDVRSDYQHNEVACDYNAAFQGILAMFVELACYDYTTVLQDSLLFYEAQRSGKLPSDQRVTWRKDSALNDKGNDGEDLTGGYYDAGDYVKFGFPMAFTTTVLSWGLLDHENGYQKANSVDDCRKAIKWATDWFLKAHVSANEYYGQVGSGTVDHASWGRPEDMTMERPAFKITTSAPGSDLAAETAAALAAASLVFQSVDSTYAATLLEHAKQLYDFGYNYRGLFSDSITDSQCCYTSTHYEDELVWGAAWLYRATNDQKYLGYVDELYSTVQSMYGFDWDQKFAGAMIAHIGSLLYERVIKDFQPQFVFPCHVSMCPPSPQIKRNPVRPRVALMSHTMLYKVTKDEKYATDLKNYCDYVINSSSRTPKGLIFIYDWGPARYAANLAFIFMQVGVLYLVSSRKSGTLSLTMNMSPCHQAADLGINADTYRAEAKKQIDYILGDGGRSYVIGYGDNYPTHAHHRSSSCPDAPATCDWNTYSGTQPNVHVLYGGMVGGPDKNDAFEDLRSDWRHTEVGCDYNAAFQSTLAHFVELGY
uniref:Endoglucanase n=1 Tax=Timema monikensis TaxID=170555 RepID=A0A7R9E710_9NEOP|nr:unnamed protein product [Timema monikensis]